MQIIDYVAQVHFSPQVPKVATRRASRAHVLKAMPVRLYIVRIVTADVTAVGRTYGYGWVQDIAVIVHLESGTSHLVTKQLNTYLIPT